MGDIGTHAAHLAEYISGLKISQLCADLSIMVAGRALDDDGNVPPPLRQRRHRASSPPHRVAAGEENALKIRIYGENGGVSNGHSRNPIPMLVKWLDQPTQVYRAGMGYLGNYAKFNTRTPGGHPKATSKPLATSYRDFAITLMAPSTAPPHQKRPWTSLGGKNGVRGMAFIE